MKIRRRSINCSFTSEPDSKWICLDIKHVRDSDGMLTDYALYTTEDEDKYICMFGDVDAYPPDEMYADAEFDSEEAALEWFEDYTGPGDEDEDYDTYHDDIDSANSTSNNPQREYEYRRNIYLQRKHEFETLGENDNNDFLSREEKMNIARAEMNKVAPKYANSNSKEYVRSAYYDDDYNPYSFMVGDQLEWSGLYGGEYKGVVTSVNDEYITVDVMWTSEDSGDTITDTQQFEITTDPDGKECIIVWVYGSDAGYVYPPSSDDIDSAEELDEDEDDLDHPDQEFDSADTSINSTKLPAASNQIIFI